MATFDQEPASPTPQPKRRSCLFWVLIVILVGFLGCGGLCAGGVYLLFGKIKQSEPYEKSLELVQQSPEVIDRIGEPIEPAFLVSGEVNFENDQGSSVLDFDVNGPKGKAHVRSQSTLIDGTWGITVLDVTFDEDGTKISIDTGDDGLEEAPGWPPSEDEPMGGIDLSEPEENEIPPRNAPDPFQDISLPTHE